MLAVRWRPDGGRTNEPLAVADTRAALSAHGLTWLDAQDPTADELGAIADATGFGVARLRGLVDGGRPGLHPDQHQAAVVLPETSLDQGRLRTAALLLLVGATWIVTCRSAAGGELPDPLDDELGRLSANPADRQRPVDAVLVVVDALLDRQMDVSDDLDDRLAAAEDDLLEAPESASMHDPLVELRRDVLALHRVTGPVRRLLTAIMAGTHPVLQPRDVDALRYSHDAVLELKEQIATQLMLLNGLFQTQVAAASIRSNHVMTSTSSWGAILVVATLITGIYGMNFRHMPELRWQFGYGYALLLIVVTTIVLYRLFKWRGWL